MDKPEEQEQQMQTKEEEQKTDGPTADERIAALEAQFAEAKKEPEPEPAYNQDDAYSKLLEKWGEDEPAPSDEQTDVEKLNQKVDKLAGMLTDQAKMNQENQKAGQVEKLIAGYAETVPDWKEIKAEVIKLAKMFGGKINNDEELFQLARAKVAGFGKTPINQQKQETKVSAKEAASEKPTGAGSNTDREFHSVKDAAEDSMREILAQQE